MLRKARENMKKKKTARFPAFVPNYAQERSDSGGEILISESPHGSYATSANSLVTYFSPWGAI